MGNDESQRTGRQHVNRTESAVRVTHVQSGMQPSHLKSAPSIVIESWLWSDWLRRLPIPNSKRKLRIARGDGARNTNSKGAILFGPSDIRTRLTFARLAW